MSGRNKFAEHHKRKDMHISRESKPIASVIIPTYNRADMIAKSIDSVLAQDFGEFEIIVSDDGSTDNTLEVLSQYGDKITVVTGPNAGCATARTRAIQAARGQLIANHDSDDLMLPGRLTRQVEFMTKHSEVAVVSGNIIIEDDEQTNYLENCGVDFGGQPWVVFEHPFQKLLCRNFMTDAASMIRCECFVSIGGYDLSLRRSADWDLWLRMSRKWPLACMNTPCTWVGKHEGNRTVSPVENACNIRIIDRALRCGEPLDQHSLQIILKRLYLRLRSYVVQNLMGSSELGWVIETKRCAEHLIWYHQLFLRFVLALPHKFLRFLLGFIIRIRGAFR